MKRFYQAKKNILMLCALMAACAVLFAACGGSGKGADTAAAAVTSSTASYEMAANDMGMVESDRVTEMAQVTEEAPTADVSMAPVLDERKIIRHSYISLETMEFDQAVEQIKQTISSLGGYIESQSMDGGQSYYNGGKYYERSASINARIPSEKLDQATSDLQGICNMTSMSENMEDITDTYYDAQARLDSLTLQEERLLDILSKAEKLEDVIQLETALSDVRYQIESITASLRRMDSQVTYSYLNIDLREVSKYQQMETAPKSFGEKLAASFNRGEEHLANFLQGTLLFLAEAGPILIFWLVCVGVIILVVVLVSKKRQKSLKQKKGLPTQENQKLGTTDEDAQDK